MLNLKITLLFVSCLLCANCADSSSDINPDDRSGTTIENDLLKSDYNILFIGNSLTYTNDLPALVRSVAKKAGNKVGTKSIAKGNYALEDHWNDGYVQQEIESQKFDFVVVQQGPSSQTAGREMLFEFGAKFKDLCVENDAQLTFYMVWPSMSYYSTFDGVIENYQDAASANDAIICPVGKVWKDHFDKTGEFDYYGPDGFHPSKKGSEIAAQVIVESLFP